MGNFEVYQDPHFSSADPLKGVKGSTYLEPGYIYAPYVPMQVTSITNPVYGVLKKAGLKVKNKTEFTVDDFKPRKGIMSRYATKKVKKEFYGTITIGSK